MPSFQVKWGTQKFDIDVSSQEEMDTMTVADLKHRCQQLCDIEPQYMKLLAYGAVLKDDNELLKNYKVGPGAKVMMMGSKTHCAIPRTPPKADASVATRLLWSKNLRESVLKPDIKRYQKQAEEHLMLANKDPKQTKQLVNYGSYLYEQLMHMLQQLDTMPEVSDQERLERKSNVKETEALLDLIESIRSKLNE